MVVDDAIWTAVFENDKGRCRYCGFDLGASLDSFLVATVDHVVARSAGGSDKLENLVLACKPCNEFLSRANHLTSVGARRERVLKRRAERRQVFEEHWEDWCKNRPGSAA